MWENLRKKIKDILTANTRISAVYDYEADNFSVDPVAVVVASSNDSDYRTTTANRRVYAFSIQLWVKREGQYRDDKTAEDVLTDLVDSVIDDFDRYYTLGTGSPGSALVLPTGYTMIKVEALPSEWFYGTREALYRAATINIRCHMDVDVTLIS
jgi:hypothetical protein